MLNDQLDCRGLVCPLPVIETKKALANLIGDSLTVIVDNQTAKENIVKFATSQKCGASVEAQDEIYRIRITRPTESASVPAETQGTTWLITQDTLGHGNKELGAVLMKSFFYTLTERPLPEKILFINSGVLLTLSDSPVLTHIRTLTDKGVEILSCGTCLDYYQAKERLAVGAVTNMYTIVEALTSNRSVVL